MRYTRTAAAVTAVLLFGWACQRPARPSQAAPDGVPRIRFELGPSASGTVDIVGLPAEDLSRLERSTPGRDEWTALFRVVVAGGADPSSNRPAVLGTYSIGKGVLRFTPQFPFDPGQRYDVVLDPSHLPSGQEGRP